MCKKEMQSEFESKTLWVSSTLLVIAISAVVSTVLWTFWAELDQVTRVPGRVVPAEDIQKVQAVQEGVISAVFINEGDIIEIGAPLIELDAVVQNSQLDSEYQKFIALQARLDRLNAEVNDAPLVFSPDVQENAPMLIASETLLYESRAASLGTEISILEDRKRQRLFELDETESDLRTALRTKDLIDEEMKVVLPLVEQGVEPKPTGWRLQRELEETLGRISVARSNLEGLNSSIAEVDGMIEAERLRYRTSALNDLAEATGELAALQPSLPALETIANRTIVRSSSSGIVNRLHRKTVGGSVRAGEVVAEIVPTDDQLLIEAYVEPKDIAFIAPDQAVRVKITAYDFTRYGALGGNIIRIGADAVLRNERDEHEVFIITIKVEGSLTDADGNPVAYIPGMTAEVDILAGKRRVVDYLLEPLRRLKARAFQE